MPRLLTLAAAVCCALAFALIPSPLVFIPPAFLVSAYGIRLARTQPTALIATALTLAGLAMLAVSLMPAPAAAAGRPLVPVLTAMQMPPAPLAIAAPAPPQQIVVSVAKPDPAETSVAVPINEWAAAARNTVMALLLAFWGFARNKLPGPVLFAVKMVGEKWLIEQAVNLGINAVPGAVKDAPLNVNVGNAVLAHALQWVVNEVPGFVVKMMGGEEGIRAKIFAALNLEEDASAATFGVATTG